MMGRKAWDDTDSFQATRGDDSGREKSVKNVLPVPCPIEQEARDDILGGISMTAIAGLFPTFTFQGETITPDQVLSVQNWTCFRPEARKQGELTGVYKIHAPTEASVGNRVS